jgi:hypothetical protein
MSDVGATAGKVIVNREDLGSGSEQSLTKDESRNRP